MDPLPDIWREIAARPTGPFAFRFYLQPLMAAVFALRDGLRDARLDRSPYLSSFYKNKGLRRALVQEAWASIGKIFILAVVLDVLYQAVVLHGLRPLEGLLVALGLAVVPYVLIRGPVSRIARRALGGTQSSSRSSPSSTA